MGRRTVAQFAHQIKRVLSPTVLNDLGRRVGFCHRERLITPYRLVLSLLAGHATCVRAHRSTRRCSAYTWEGEALEGWSGQSLKQGGLSKGETVDLDVVWGKGAKALGLRLLARWNPDEGCHTLLVTNLARSRFRAEQVGQLYRLRWQVELLFKEWKSYANPCV